MRVGTLEIQILAGLARLQKDMNDAQRMVGGAMGNVEKSVASAKRAMQALGVGLPLAAITDQVRRMTDQYTKLDAQLRLSTKSQAQYAQGMADIRRISTVAQADISATSMLYTRLMNVMQGTGVEQSKLATVTETVSFGLKAYGATAQEASSAALQLSQAMGANRLGGEEFRAVMEAMPNVMKVVADSMGVPLGSLRQLSIDGKITADVLVKALGDPAIAAQFKAMAMNAQTVTGAWIVARNELMLLIGEFMKSSGATSGAIAAFNGIAVAFALLAKHMQSLILIASTYAAFLVTKWAVGTAMAIEKSIAHTEALAMNAAGTRAHAAVVAQAAAAESAAESAAAIAKQAHIVATREALFATEAEVVAKITSTRATIAQSQATIASAAGILQTTLAKQAATAATAELAIAEATLAKIEKARNAAHVEALAMDVVRTRELKATAIATNAAAAAEAARATSALGWIASIGVALRAAAMAHPITAAIVAITAIITAIANWDTIVKSSKATFTWFMDDFIGGLAFGAKVAGIELAAFVQKIIFVKDNFDKLFSADPNVRMEFARGMKQLTDIAESEKIRAAAVMRGIDDDTRNREALEQAMRQAQDREAWDKLHATKQQQRAAEIAELDAQYIKLAGVQGRSQAEQLALAEEYRVKLALINEKYSRADVKAAVKADKELQAMREVSIKYEQDIVDGINAETDALLKKIEQERFDTEAIGKTAEQLALLQSVRYDNVTSLLEQKLATLESVYASEAEIAAIRDQIKARKELKGVWEAQAAAQVRDAEKKAWKEIWDSVDKTAHDTFVSILNGGKDTATRLKEAFKNGFFDWLYSMTLKKWIINIGTSAAGGASGAAMAGTGVSAGGSSWMSAGYNMFNTMKLGFDGIATGFTELAGTISGSLQSIGVAAETAGSIGVAGAYLGAGLAGIQLGSMIAGDKKVAGMGGTVTSGIGAGIGALVGGPLGALVGGALGGVFSAAFGRGPKVSGTTTLAGQFGASGFAGQYQTPWSQSGGWFSSGRSGIDITPLTVAQAKALNSIVAGGKSVFDNLTTAAGEAQRSLVGWTFSINRQIATQDQQNQLIIDMSDSMGLYLIPQLSQFRLEGENLADTAVRMRDVFVVTDAILGLVGRTFSEVGLASMQMRASLVDLLGGVQQANASMQAYYQAFFSEEERAINGWRQMAASLRQLGVVDLPTTNAQFRALIEAQDLNTVSGQETFAALISLSSTFSSLTASTASLTSQTGKLASNLNLLSTEAFATLVDYTRYVRKATAIAANDTFMQQVQQVLATAPATTPKAVVPFSSPVSVVPTVQPFGPTNPNPANVAAKAAALQAYYQAQAIADNSNSGLTLVKAQKAWAAYQALPAFAEGGTHSGGLRLVGENGPELEYTGPSTIFSNGDSRNMLDNSSVVASVDALREELRALGLAIAAPIQKQYKLLDRWNGEGMPEVREAA